MRIKYDPNTTALKDKLYPIVKEAFDKPATRNAYKDVINTFITKRADDLYDSLPCDRLVCNESTMDELFPKIYYLPLPIKSNDVQKLRYI